MTMYHVNLGYTQWMRLLLTRPYETFASAAIS